MTPRQKQILIFIAEYWEENWTSPAVREIAAAVGLSSASTVHVHLENMVRDGHLERKTISTYRVLYRPAREALD